MPRPLQNNNEQLIYIHYGTAFGYVRRGHFSFFFLRATSPLFLMQSDLAISQWDMREDRFKNETKGGEKVFRFDNETKRRSQ